MKKDGKKRGMKDVGCGRLPPGAWLPRGAEKGETLEGSVVSFLFFYKESWMPKNWCFWTMVLEKTLESPLDCKEIKPVNPKGNWSWIFIGRIDAKAETPILWPPDVKNWLIGKDPDAGKDWRQEEKGMTEDEMVGWQHRLNRQWVWASSGSWWWTGRHDMLQSMGSQRVGHDWATELNWVCDPATLFLFLYSYEV